MVDPKYFVGTKPLWLGAMAAFPYSAALYARFWVANKYYKPPEDGATPEEIMAAGEPRYNLSRRDGKLLLVPRELALGKPVKDLRSGGDAAVEFVEPATFVFRNEVQARAYAESLALLQAGHSHIIRATTGIGKTVIACRLALALGMKVAVVVNKEDQMGEEQWRGSLRRFAGVPESQIGIIRQKKCQVEGRTACLAMIHSLAKDKYPQWIYDEFGLVIFDEVHHVSADTFQRVAGAFNSSLRLGLSAGASRKADEMRSDGRDIVFEAHIGPVAVKAEWVAVNPKVLVLRTGHLLKRVPRRINAEWKYVPLPHEPGKIGHIVRNMVKDPARNALIVKLAVIAWKKGRHVVIFSDLGREKHLDLLHALLVASGVPPKEIGFYVGGMKDTALEATKRLPVVLATYGMCAEATDVPRWDTCILATPRANVRQIIGRILREHSDKGRPIVCDLVDDDSWVCAAYFKARCSLYLLSEIGAEVVEAHIPAGV